MITFAPVVSLVRATKYHAITIGRCRQCLAHLLDALPRFCPQADALTALHADVCQLCVTLLP